LALARIIGRHHGDQATGQVLPPWHPLDPYPVLVAEIVSTTH
jgi:hypothetical protein